MAGRASSPSVYGHPQERLGPKRTTWRHATISTPSRDEQCFPTLEARGKIRPRGGKRGYSLAPRAFRLTGGVNLKGAATMELPAAQTAVVADTHPLSLDSLGVVVAGLGIELIARETKVERVAGLVESHKPDLLVLGVDVVDAAVQKLLRVVQQMHPNLRVVVISDDDPRSAQAAFAAGAHAFCQRIASADDLAAAIRQSFERSIHLRPLLADPATPQMEAYPELAYLTRREVEILRLAAEGRTNKQIAGTLWVTLHTVKFHLSNIYRKLNVASRAEATRWAERHGLLGTRSQVGAGTRRR